MTQQEPEIVLISDLPEPPSPKYTSWVRLIRREMENVGDEWDETEDSTLTESELLSPFLGNVKEPGKAFTLWTKERVYFPTWDSEHGQTGVASAPRNPSGIPTRHIGSDWWIEDKI